MSFLFRIILLCTLCLLSACSFGADESPEQPTARRQAPAAVVRAERVLPGRLLYVRDGQIWLHEGSDAQPLKIEGRVRDPAWSSDGRYIAFIERHESYADLYVLDTQSGETLQVTDNGNTQ